MILLNTFKLKDLSQPAKVLVIFFVICLLAGYAVALLQGYEHSGFDLNKTIQNYRGSDNPDLMAFPKPYRELLQNTHAHILSVPLVYLLLSLIFLGTKLTKKWQSILIAILFSAFLIEHFSFWGLRYVDENFIYLIFSASGFAGLIYLYMCCKILYDLR